MDWSQFNPERMDGLCPACGYTNPDPLDPCCDLCYWERMYEGESSPDKVIGPNHISLNESRRLFKSVVRRLVNSQTGAVAPAFVMFEICLTMKYIVN